LTRLPRINGKDVVKALKRAGFEVVNIEGSHHQMHRPGRGLVTVQVHPRETLPPKTLKSILKQAGLTVDELIDLL
jgi:predicted RNA binding protein YcfA (HicA-like mRNA interferase family)